MAQQVTKERAESPQPLTSAVLFGRQDTFSVFLRLAGMELYKIRRRAMSKVFITISLLATVLLYAFVALIVFFATKYVPAQSNTANFSEPLRLPSSLFLAGQLLTSLGQLLIVILVSVIVGGEYTSNTIRLILTRGPSRAHIFLAKIGASLVCIVLAVFGIMLLGILSGLIFNLTTGVTQNFAFLNYAWIGHFLLYLLLIALNLFIYAMMAILLSIVGRSIAAGIVGVLVWIYIVESLIDLIGFVGSRTGGTVSAVLQALPNYLIGNNIATLQQAQLYALSHTSVIIPSGALVAPPNTLHALLVLAVYLILFIGLAWWVFMQRDITN